MEVPKWEARKCSNGRDKVHLWVQIEAYRMMKDESWWSLGVIVIGQWVSDIQKESFAALLYDEVIEETKMTRHWIFFYSF